MSIHSHRVGHFACSFCLATAAVAVSTSLVLGQAAKVMVLKDGENEPVIAHFSMPDIAALRQPDFTRLDLPTFQERLLLSEAQSAAIQAQIDTYLAAFQQLQDDMLNVPGLKPLVVHDVKIDGEDGGRPGKIMLAPANEADLPPIELDLKPEGELAGDFNFDVSVRVAGPGEEGDGGEGEPSVAIAFAAPEGEEIPEDLRKQLEERAAELAERIKQRIQEQQENAADEQGFAAALPGMDAASLEKIKQQQEQLAVAVAQFRRAKSDLRQHFVAEAQTVLTSSQVERWPGLERALLRERSLPKGRLSGETTDLFKIVKNLDAAPEHLAAIQAELDNYELSLDNALRQRDAYIEDVDKKLEQAMQERDYDRALSIIDRGADLRIAIRTINEQYTHTIASMLPDLLASKLQEAVLHQSYPRVYRPTHAQRTFEAAARIDNLDEQVRSNLRELEHAYLVELEQANAAIRRAIDRHEPLQSRRPIEHMKAIASGEEPRSFLQVLEDDPIRQAFAKRRELDDRYIKTITSMLTPDQAEQLPKPPSPRAISKPVIIRSGSE